MARIRSIHPGQATDEDFVSCSAIARLFALLLRGEADDHGVFEWKPVTLKMRILPADSVDVGDLLAELVDSNQVQQFTADDKPYGVIRNFCTWQRPRKPKYTYPFPDHLRDYVGLKDEDGDKNTALSTPIAYRVDLKDDPVPQKSSPNTVKAKPVPQKSVPAVVKEDTVPQKSVIAPQMKEEGGGREEVYSEANASGGDPPDDRLEIPPFLKRETPEEKKKALAAKIFDVALPWLSEATGKPPVKLRPMVGKWIKENGEGLTLQAIIDCQRLGIIEPVSWITAALLKGKKDGTASNARTFAAANATVIAGPD